MEKIKESHFDLVHNINVENEDVYIYQNAFVFLAQQLKYFPSDYDISTISLSVKLGSDVFNLIQLNKKENPENMETLGMCSMNGGANINGKEVSFQFSATKQVPKSETNPTKEVY